MVESNNEHASNRSDNVTGPIDAALMQDKEHLEWIAAYYASRGYVQRAHEIYQMLKTITNGDADQAPSRLNVVTNLKCVQIDNPATQSAAKVHRLNNKSF